DGVPFDALDVEGRVDWLLLRARIHDEEQLAGIAKAKRDEMAPLIPFADSILALDTDLRHMVFINGADAAARVTAVGDRIAALTADIEAGRLKASPTVGRRAARAVRDLRVTLKEWRDFYNGYDPAFTWWIAEPWKRVDAALDAYATLLGEKIAGVKSSDKDTIVGDPVGGDALQSALRDEFIPYTPEQLIDRARIELA